MEREYFDHDGRAKKHDRIRASMHVLLGRTEEMQQRLREGIEMGGLLREIPISARYPLESEALVFRSKEELEEFADRETAGQLIACQEARRAEALSAYREWATNLLHDLTLIAETRMNGIQPEQIVTTKHLKMVLATEAVSQKMMASISENRKKIQEVIEGLMNQSEAGVKAMPLAATMREIGQLCQKMNEDMQKLAQAAAIATGQLEDETPQCHSGVVALADRARQIFSPFIQGNHVITMRQLHELESFLLEAGNYNENIGVLIQDGVRAIQKAKKEGKYQEVRKIEEFLGFDDHLSGFERITQALDRNFVVRAGIIANAGAQNRVVLKSTPPAMLKQAEMESGLVSTLLLGKHMERDMDLVLPSHDDLELR